MDIIIARKTIHQICNIAYLVYGLSNIIQNGSYFPKSIFSLILLYFMCSLNERKESQQFE